MLNQREMRKFLSFATFVEDQFNLNRYAQIYDLCCGVGAAGIYFSKLGKDVIALDNQDNTRRTRLLNEMGESYQFIKQSIFDLPRLLPNSLVLSIHACGSLTDRVIELSIASKNDFAVMSCCHGDRVYFTPQELPSNKIVEERGRDYHQDMLRLQFIREQDYLAGIYEIPAEITPKNRIIWGINNSS